MKTEVYSPQGSLEDMKGQVQDVISSVIMYNAFEPNTSVLRALIIAEVKEKLTSMARKVGGQDAPAVQVGFDELAPAEVDKGKLSGYVDLGIRFRFTVEPE